MIVVDYFEKLKLAILIKEEIKNHYSGHDDYLPYKKIKKIHGLLERNLKIVETEDGFELYVPMAYGKKYVEICMKNAISKWKREMKVKGKVKTDEKN